MINALVGHKVEISDDISIAAVIRWLENHSVDPMGSYVYIGHNGNKEVFSFKNKDHAMLFKLTWGGE